MRAGEMPHLTDQQCSALVDDVLSPTERTACEAHLADCDECRARLAALSALDESLGRALAHDPGDAYFADFAERVGRRIATESAGRPDAAAKARRSPWEWFTSPGSLRLAGSTAGLVLTAGIRSVRLQH